MSDFQFNPAAVSPLAEVKVSVARPTHTVRIADEADDLPLKGAGAEYRGTSLRFGGSSERARLEALAILIHTAHGGVGMWNDLPKKLCAELGYDGWVDSSGRIMNVAELEAIVTARIVELHLDRNLLEAHLSSHVSVAESQAFYGLSFEERMQKFRRSTGE